jgi:putative tricarboxylic transport membrane protein
MLDIVEASVAGLVQVFAWPTFGLMLLGTAIGFVVGILPGLGGPTTLALMLPFTFKMSPVEAFAFLLGMAVVTATTGDITSILLGIPGEPTTASTIVDGHPMAKNGEAGRALGAALTSSLVGAIFGAVVLALAIPVVRPLVLTFGSPEFFMLALLGVTFVAALSGEALLKGLIAGGMGLWLATIGLDPVSGTQRYTLGQLFLWDGIGLVPLTIGFFAIPEVIDLAVQGTSIARLEMARLGGVWEGVRDTFRHWQLVLRCSAVGTFVSIIPGMGAATTQWLAYAHAVQSSPDRSRFGKGAVEGVLGPGAANNSSLGGSLITTLAFGVPASVMMAILLGGFLIQGLIPGPPMLTPARLGGHLTLTFSLVWTIVIANVITVAVCLGFVKQLARITQVRGSLLIPFILLLVYLGAFAEKNAVQDLLVMLVFGALGWAMVQLGWPRPPLVLGLVLGPLAENKLFLATDNYGAAWLGRPGVLTLLGIMLVGLAYPLLREPRRERPALPDSAERALQEPRAVKPGGRASLGFGWATAFSVLLVGVFGWAAWQSRTFGFRAGLFPWAVGVPTLVLAVVQLVRTLPDRGDGAQGTGLEDEPPGRVAVRRTAEIAAWIVGFWAAISVLGFSAAVPVVTFLYLRIGAREPWLISTVLTLLAFGFFYGLFDRVLRIPFPPGQLLGWLGA